MDKNDPNDDFFALFMSDDSASANTGEEIVDLNLHPSGIVPTLESIAATAKLNCPLDLKEIALHVPNTKYNPEKRKGLIMRMMEPEARALIFASGKMVVVGIKSEELCLLAAHKCADIIQKLGYPTKLIDFRVQNIVGKCDVGFLINLEGLAISHAQFSSYKPKRFKAVIYRMVKPKIMMLIYESGKVVLTGAKIREDLYQAFEIIYPVILEFRKQLDEHSEVDLEGTVGRNNRLTVRMYFKW